MKFLTPSPILRSGNWQATHPADDIFLASSPPGRGPAPNARVLKRQGAMYLYPSTSPASPTLYVQKNKQRGGIGKRTLNCGYLGAPLCPSPTDNVPSPNRSGKAYPTHLSTVAVDLN